MRFLVLFVVLPAILGPACHQKKAPHKDDLTPPAGLVVTAFSTTRIDLTWANVAVDATDVEIERSVENGPFTLLATVPISQSTYSDLGLIPGTEYTYQLRSLKAGQQGPFTNPPASMATVLVTLLAPVPDPVFGVPSARVGHVCVYVPGTRQMYLFGGKTTASTVNDLWVLDLTVSPPAWTNLDGVPSGFPSGERTNHSGVYDSTYDRIVFYGGLDILAGTEFDDVFCLNLSPGLAWDFVPFNNPGIFPIVLQGHSATYDPVGQRMMVYGGSGFNFVTGGFDVHRELWEFTLPTPGNTSDWIDRTPLTSPPARTLQSAVLNPPGTELVVFGGNSALPYGVSPRGDAWSADIVTPAWSPVVGGPSPRFGHSAVVRGTDMLVFGGTTGTLTSELWKCSLTGTPAWTRLTIAAPGLRARLGHTAIYDPAASRMIVFGGGTDPLAPLVPGEVWEFRF